MVKIYDKIVHGEFFIIFSSIWIELFGSLFFLRVDLLLLFNFYAYTSCYCFAILLFCLFISFISFIYFFYFFISFLFLFIILNILFSLKFLGF